MKRRDSWMGRRFGSGTRSRNRSRSVGFAAAAAAALAFVSRANATTWLGGAGSYSDPTRWDTGLLPQGALDAAVIDGGNPISSAVTLSGNYVTGALFLDANDTFSVGDAGSFLQLHIGGQQVNGTVNLAGGLTLLDDGALLNGAGTINFLGGSLRNAGLAGSVMTAGAGLSLVGQGLLMGGSGNLVNQANVIGTFNTLGMVVNQGTITGSLVVQQGSFNNQGRVMISGTNALSTISFQNSGSGSVRVQAGAQFYLSGPAFTNSGSFALDSAGLIINIPSGGFSPSLPASALASITFTGANHIDLTGAACWMTPAASSIRPRSTARSRSRTVRPSAAGPLWPHRPDRSS